MPAPGFVEKRRTSRWNSVTKVKVIAGGKSAVCMAVNIGSGGVAVLEVGLGLRPKARVELRFMLQLSNGTTKIHLRHATVAHVTKGVTGFTLDSIPPISAPRYSSA